MDGGSKAIKIILKACKSSNMNVKSFSKRDTSIIEYVSRLSHVIPVSPTIVALVLEWHSSGQLFDPAQLHTEKKSVLR